jgi:NADH-quinone oxidoreductase subunit N
MNTLFVVSIPAILLIGAILVILLDAFLGKNAASKTLRVAQTFLLISMAAAPFLWEKQGASFGGMFVMDSFSLITGFLFCLAAFVSLLLSEDATYSTAQFHSLVLLTVVGMLLLVGGAHLLVIFIGLEILSLSVYVLAAFAKGDPLSAESGLKYFLLGSFASAFFLYGTAFIYGGTGSLQLNAIAAAITKGGIAGRPLLMLGIVFLLVGYGFKISLAPFHMWTPDVYEGAPTSVTAFMATTVKVAALSSLVRVLLISLPNLNYFWLPVIWLLSVITMFWGNLAAIWQDNLKRLLAYSSIAHAGYMLIGLLAPSDQAQQSILYYFAAYVFMNLGAFTVVAYLERHAGILKISEYQGLAYTRPLLTVCMTLFLLSLGGLPPTAGFFGKFYLFRAALQGGHVWIVVLAVINSAISFYYYLRVVISMFLPEKEAAVSEKLQVSLPLIVTIVLTVWGTISLGLFPGFFLELARAASLLS